MKRITILIFSILISLGSVAQKTIDAYEYWFNADFNGRTHQPISSTANFTLETDISVDAMPTGLNAWHIRFLQSDGTWSQATTQYFQKMELTTTPKKLQAYEYWFDNETGTKNFVELASATANYELLEDINVQSLTDGLHFFNVRFLQDDGTWSEVITQYFQKMPDALTARQIDAYEYWFDNDYANKTITELASPVANYNMDLDFNLDALSPGLHFFHIRYRQENGKWSQAVSQAVQKIDNSVNNYKITAYEYWFDNNYAGKTSQTLETQKGDYSLDTDISLESLTPGLHFFHIRFMQENGTWSQTISQAVQKIDNTVNNYKITAYEYWFDQNTTERTYTTISSPTSNYSINEDFSVDALTPGLHSFNIRFLQENGQWSEVITQFFQRMPEAVTPTNITAYQYWFDQNYADAPVVFLETPTPNYEFLSDLPIEPLSDGDHSVSLRFLDDLGRWSAVYTDSFTRYPTPVPNFAVDFSVGCDELTVTFTNSSENTSSYLWHFGDGNTSTEENPVHTYTAPGIYTVQLEVISSEGDLPAELTKTDLIQVKQTVTFTGLPETCLNTDEPFELTGLPPGGTFSGIGITGNTFVPEGLEPGLYEITYSYTGDDACGTESVQNVRILDIPEKPLGLNATALAPTVVKIQWTDAADNEAGFNIYRSKTNNSSYELIGTGEADQTQFFDTETSQQNTYYYYVEAQNAAGVSGPSDEISIQTPCAAEEPSYTEEVYCTGSDIVLNVDGQNILWYDSPDLSSQIGIGSNFNTGITETGAYYYYVTQQISGCISIPIQIEVVVYPSPEITDVQVTDESYCNAGNGSIVIVANSDVSLLYSVDNGENYQANYTFYYLSSGVYPVIVKNEYECTDFAGDFIITSPDAPPMPTAGKDTSYCEGETMENLTASGSGQGNLLWYDNSNLENYIGSGTVFTPIDQLGTTIYYVVEEVDNCKSAAASVTVVMTAVPSPPLTQSADICEGDEVPKLRAQGLNLKWYNPDSQLLYQGNEFITGQFNPGRYNYTVTQETNGCVSTPAPIYLAIYAKPSPTISGIDEVCLNQGNAIYTSAYVANHDYLWNISGGSITGGSGTDSITVDWTSPGTGTVNLVETVSGIACSTPSETFNVTVHSAVSLDVPQIVVKFGAVLVCKNLNEAFISYQWYNEDGAIEGATEQFYEPPYPIEGEYYMVTVDANTCEVESNRLSFDSQKSASFDVYPNPATSEITVRISNSDIGLNTITLINPQGAVIYRENIRKNTHKVKYEIPVNYLSRGIYFLQVASDYETVTQQIVLH